MAKPFEYILFLEGIPMNSAVNVQMKLFSLISQMNTDRKRFVRNPETDFSRKRKLSFQDTVLGILSMESSSLKKELLKFFDFSLDTPTVSAFCQQRDKLLPAAFEFLFHAFNSCFHPNRTYRGYHLLACDGSDLLPNTNPNQKETFFQTAPSRKGFNLLHLNALYDLCDKQYKDALIQPGRQRNEYTAMADMVDRYEGDTKTIFLCDRGYENYNLFAHVAEKGMAYLNRIKDRDGKSMASSFALPEQEEFDHSMSLTLTRQQDANVRKHPKLYRRIDPRSRFDYLDEEHHYYVLDFRVVRFKIKEDCYECIITNLPKETFPAEEIKKLYAMRWGIETSFRELKYAIGLNCFHSKKTGHLEQEIYARLILYNFCEIITMDVVIEKKDTKHIYQANHTVAIHICRHFLRGGISPPAVETMIQKNLLPVRPKRQASRKVGHQSAVSFLYRA